tara:strand:+ start:88 stop:363 length:276 start_codon:yes stop_codon:yes gene_type:complete
MAYRNPIIQQWLGLNMDEDEQKYRMGMMENVRSPADFGQARPSPHGRGQYAAQDRPVVDLANMPGLTLAQGQPQYANLMNIRSRLPRRYLG